MNGQQGILRPFNLVMAAAHLAQAALIILLSSDFALPITSAFLEFNPRTSEIEPLFRQQASVEIGPLVAGFFLISAIAHFSMGSFGYARYRENLAKEINPIRWIEYAFSSSLMIVIIAMLVGIYDIASLILIFGVNATMILFGWTMELQNRREKVSWLPYMFGVVAGAFPWIAIGIYLFGSGSEGQGPPAFVYYIYLSIFLFFNVFALIMALQYRGKGRFANYLYGEKAYIWLSLFAKSALAWQVFAGTLRPV